MLAVPILVLARAIPIVLMKSAMRCFWSAKTCSTPDLGLDRALLARRFASGIGLPGGLRKWTFETSPALAIFFSFFLDR